MAARIDTTTAIPDLFGPGRHGFGEGPPATELSPVWCNNLQEETCRYVEAAGLVVDPLVLDQMAQAAADFPLGSPTLSGTLTVENGALIDVLAGGQIMADVGSTVTLAGTVTIGGTATFTCIADASFSNDVTLGDVPGDAITVNGATTFNADVQGPAVSLTFSTVNASVLAPTQTQYPTAAPSSADGFLVYNGRRLSIGDGTASRRIDSPREAYVTDHTTSFAVEDIPGASVTMDIGDNEFVECMVSVAQSIDAAGEDVRIAIAASNGVDSVIALNNGQPDVADLILPTSVAAGDNRPNGFVVRWKPTNDIPVPNNTTWTLQVRHGTTGNNLTSTKIKLEVTYV